MIKQIFLSLLFTAFAQEKTLGQPGTEIFIFDLEVQRGGLKISAPRNISEHFGYDNQPFFHPTQPLLYYVSADSSGNTDIIEFNYGTSKKRKLIDTPDREYSPQVTPDGKYISCIIQRQTGAQDLGKYPIDGGVASVLIDSLIVGYHAWVDSNSLVVFTLPQPFTLRLVDLTTKKDSAVASSIGRSLHKIPEKKAISFVQKVDDTLWEIRMLDVQQKRIFPIVKSISNKEHDMTWLHDGKILMSNGSKIFFYDTHGIQEWNEVAIKANIKLNTITRLAVNSKGDKIALVINE